MKTSQTRLNEVVYLTELGIVVISTLLGMRLTEKTEEESLSDKLLDFSKQPSILITLMKEH